MTTKIMNMKMKKTFLMLTLIALMGTGTAMARDIRVVEISTGSDMRGHDYENSITSVLKTLSGVSKVVADVTNLVLTITYDADVVCVDDIVGHINKQEPRFKAKQKSQPKTKKWVKAEKKRDKAEKKVEKERDKADQRDKERERGGKR